MSTGLRRALWALPLVIAGVSLALWHRAGSGVPAVVAVIPPVPPAADAAVSAPPETAGQPSAALPAEADAPEGPLDAWALRQLCGRPWEAAFDAECVAALERTYRDTVPALGKRSHSFRGRFRPVLLGEPVTWAEVFDDTAGAVLAAREALARPECLVPEGGIRIELRDACAADEMAKLALLRGECTTGDPSPEGRQMRWDADMTIIGREVDQALYQQRLAWLDEMWFGKMWRIRKCRAVPEEALGALGPFQEPLGWPYNVGNEQAELMMAAARLGSDWALSSALWWGRDKPVFEVDEAYFDAVARERPVLAELLRMRHAHGVEQIMHVVVSVLLGEALGVLVHQEGVSRIIGAVDLDVERAAWRLAAPRLMALGWTLVVADPEGGPPRRFEKPEALSGDEKWIEWTREHRVTLAPRPDAPAP